MSDYKYKEGTATEWQRCAAVVIMNQHGSIPSIRMDEEKVIYFDGSSYIRPAGSLEFTYPPEVEIALRDIVTGELTGETSTCGKVYQEIYSLYMQKALERDEDNAP